MPSTATRSISKAIDLLTEHQRQSPVVTGDLHKVYMGILHACFGHSSDKKSPCWMAEASHKDIHTMLSAPDGLLFLAFIDSDYAFSSQTCSLALSYLPTTPRALVRSGKLYSSEYSKSTDSLLLTPHQYFMCMYVLFLKKHSRDTRVSRRVRMTYISLLQEYLEFALPIRSESMDYTPELDIAASLILPISMFWLQADEFINSPVFNAPSKWIVSGIHTLLIHTSLLRSDSVYQTCCSYFRTGLYLWVSTAFETWPFAEGHALKLVVDVWLSFLNPGSAVSTAAKQLPSSLARHYKGITFHRSHPLQHNYAFYSILLTKCLDCLSRSFAVNELRDEHSWTPRDDEQLQVLKTVLECYTQSLLDEIVGFEHQESISETPAESRVSSDVATDVALLEGRPIQPYDTVSGQESLCHKAAIVLYCDIKDKLTAKETSGFLASIGLGGIAGVSSQSICSQLKRRFVITDAELELGRDAYLSCYRQAHINNPHQSLVSHISTNDIWGMSCRDNEVRVLIAMFRFIADVISFITPLNSNGVPLRYLRYLSQLRVFLPFALIVYMFLSWIR